jgi:tRNA nucleotidyltransferase (CCA-adding enzyme)
MPIEKSCGAIIFRENKTRKYLLLKYGLGHWGFVKGKVEKGETEREVVIRETGEETGITKEKLQFIDDFKEKISYFYKREKKTIFKEVVFFLAKTSAAQVTLSDEHTAYEWLVYEDALDELTFKNARRILEKADKNLNKKKREKKQRTLS